MERIENMTYDAERALFGLSGATVSECRFAGVADGESALKHAHDLLVADSTFALRYPMWHLASSRVRGCTVEETCRAPLWYCRDVALTDSAVFGTKAIRECDGVTVERCHITSDEFGWMCRGLSVSDTDIASSYCFFHTSDLTVSGLELDGKYSFQYVENATVDFSTLHTKDAFWHAKNVTVRDTVIEGEYIGWYSENLTFEHCVISGTQPFVACKNLTLIDCKLEEDCDLAFERSEVTATLRGRVTSVKNPYRGRIEADGYGSVIHDGEALPGSDCAVLTRDA